MSTTEHHEYSTKLGHLRFFKNVIPCLPMKHIILIALSLSLFSFSLHATKPDNAGKHDQQKTVQNQSNAHHSDSDAVKSKNQQEKKEKKEKKEKEAKHSADDDGVEDSAGYHELDDFEHHIEKLSGNGRKSTSDLQRYPLEGRSGYNRT